MGVACDQLAGVSRRGQPRAARCLPPRSPVSFGATSPGFRVHRRTIPALALLVLSACGGAGAATSSDAAPPPPQSYPLAALSGQRLLILPTRYFSATDSL